MDPCNPDKEQGWSNCCHLACCVQRGVLDQQWDSRVPRIIPAYLKLAASPCHSLSEHSGKSDTALYLLCTVDAFLVLYPKLHRLFRIMVSLKN